jgi:hypothetical protein
MTVLSYGGTAAVVLGLCGAAARVTPLSWRNPSLAALAVVFVFGLIAITPLCGLIFDCGCDWPWNGLHHHCNVFDPDAKLKCPWCDSNVAGTLSMIAVFGLSGAAAWASPPRVRWRRRAHVPVSPSACLPACSPFISCRWRRQPSPRSPRGIRYRSPHSGRERPPAVTIW